MPPATDDILRGTPHALAIFEPNAIAELSIFPKRGKPYLECLATGKERPAKPEEIVRQLYLKQLMEDYGYPAERIAIERPVQMGSGIHDKLADIVIWDKDDPNAAYIIIECKKPKRSEGLEQLKSYCNTEGSPIGVWTNGGETIVLHRREPNHYQNLPDIPRANQTLSELLNEQWTLDDLAEHNVLVREQTTLKKIILDMENLVLANAGVDAFEEVFKLIYAKLYDEARAAQGNRSDGGKKRALQFRVGGATPTEFKRRIDALFDSAKKKWPGVFLDGDHIDLAPPHLVTCGSYLENVKLFNSNLQVIDEAFEYLSVEVGKGKKGQYFTPRHVIDMAVRMLNPGIDEYLVDTAAGSCGFTVHGIFHVWGNEFTAAGPSKWQADYAGEKVYAIDFDPRSIKIAKALNLIAGDGRTNVYRANTLDPASWSDETKVGLRNRLRRFPDDAGRDRENREKFRLFDFDVLLTNPPFAGDIKDTRIIHQFELARKPNGKWQTKVGRDVLFIQRNLEFLRPGGRMAIVLPQGRMNNTTDAYIRNFIADRARILAVVGLHGNTFKPHTGTKTSLLFLQKWNDDPKAPPRLRCPRVDDYPIFFAVSHRGGKDTSGEYIYLADDAGRCLYDLHGHPMVDHDLFNLRGYLADQREQRLSAAGSEREKEKIERDYRDKLRFVPDRPVIVDGFRRWGRKQGFAFCFEEGEEEDEGG
uniref:Type I restriction enzyme M protein n=1 Tax=Candidatus Kentrum sp. TC TaxID=2126339 RepID=A0A450YB97_9GAMM|nr:MAG: type I restriction enzyme M protein [Candidatus Kentron sp. TC]